MDKRARKYFALILSLLVLAQKPFAVAASMGTATASPSNWEEIKKEERNTSKTDAMETDTIETDTEKDNARGDIVQVVMPVNTENVFDFIMDPQELIGETDAAAYSGSRFEEDATLFFRRSDEGAEADYSSSSDPLTIVNKGNADVKVILTAHISPDSIAGITVSGDPEFQDSGDASLYLALTDGENTVPVDCEKGAVIETVIPGILEGEAPNEYSFQLIGAVNKEGDWSEVTDVSPKITVTWMVSMEEKAVSGDEEILEDEDILDEDEIPEEEWLEEEGSEEEGLEEGSEPVDNNPEKNEENNVSGENTEESTVSASGENAEENTDNVSGENAEEGTVSASEENAEENADNASGGNTEESADSVSGESVGENADNASGENAEESADSASGENTGENADNASGENTGENESNVPGNNTGGEGTEAAF